MQPLADLTSGIRPNALIELQEQSLCAWIRTLRDRTHHWKEDLEVVWLPITKKRSGKMLLRQQLEVDNLSATGFSRKHCHVQDEIQNI